MHALRQVATRFAGVCETAYGLVDALMRGLDPLARRVGYDRLERPMAAIEAVTKGFVFDCRMCGHCVLSDTGMTCPMNCPKSLRNGPCGGVRPNGDCELVPRMRCVWVDAWAGSQRMRNKAGIAKLQPPVDHRLAGSSAWIGRMRERVASAALRHR